MTSTSAEHALAQLRGAPGGGERKSPEQPQVEVAVDEASAAHDLFEQFLAEADDDLRGELRRRVVIECGEGSPSQERLVEGLAAVSPADQGRELLRSIGKVPPRPPTRGERELGQRAPIGDLNRWFAYRLRRLGCPSVPLRGRTYRAGHNEQPGQVRGPEAEGQWPLLREGGAEGQLRSGEVQADSPLKRR
jgi:hypothetical protein